MLFTLFFCAFCKESVKAFAGRTERKQNFVAYFSFWVYTSYISRYF